MAYRTFTVRADDPITLASTCPFCENRFQVGESFTLHPTVPANSEEALKAGLGRPYTSEAALIHEWCARVLDGLDPDLEK